MGIPGLFCLWVNCFCGVVVNEIRVVIPKKLKNFGTDFEKVIFLAKYETIMIKRKLRVSGFIRK